MKHLLLITLAFCSTIAFSQAQQGEFLIGADGSFDSSVTSTSFDGDSKTYVSSGTLGIKGGYFVINKLALGLDLSTTASFETNDALMMSTSIGSVSDMAPPSRTAVFSTKDISPATSNLRLKEEYMPPETQESLESVKKKCT